MAKATKKATIEILSADSIDSADLHFISGTSTKLVLESEFGEQYVITGKKLDYHAGLLVDGNVTSVKLYSTQGHLVEKTHDFSVDAGLTTGENWSDIYLSLRDLIVSPGVHFIGSKFADNFGGTTGNDIIEGGKGADHIGGNLGKDILTGGKGNDLFTFYEGHGKDVITDFDADGGTGKQDHIEAVYPGLDAISQHGKDTLIKFGHGDTLTLIGVKASHVTMDDFLLL